ncbi:putative reverse transcriptase domain-containing protein [Tanacetum coccineum]
MPEITLPPQKRLGINLGPRIRDVWVDPREAIEDVALITHEGVNARVTELTVVQEQDTQDIYAVIEDTQDRKIQIYQNVETLFDDSQQAVNFTVADMLTIRVSVVDYRDALGRLPEAEAMINEGITAALAAHDATRNGDDSHTSGTDVRRPVQVPHECTYPDFLKCQPLNFKGIEGVVGLTQWFENMESVYSISNYIVACQVKFAMCTLQGNALTWWNSHVKTTTPKAAHAMPWRTLKKMMTDKYCPRGEIKKLKFEM